ncbi:prephenate dehydratase [Streptomyces boncukensis]|uniref:Prephenate dehydratase n=1 Tax=Streptomyces boncukensis TaxID=2711219 RepID=A0A6G4X0T2_9ACTN|nr:prephenate dehydratase [Streptomyces boncukensis]NGO70467.1 prephenate dehydratase [Streptomyces boncukensis]
MTGECAGPNAGNGKFHLAHTEGSADFPFPQAHSPGRLCYPGPEGTFTEAALRALPGSDAYELVPVPSIPATLGSVRAREAEAAFVPIENSVEGGVTATLDELAAHQPLMIRREAMQPLTFALLVRDGTRLEDVKTVTGHPAALPQVRGWLAARLPHAEWESAPSTADGARLVQEGRCDGAFAGEFTASRYGLAPAARGIHEVANAQARFVLVGRPAPPAPPTGRDKTSLVVWLDDDRPGALLQLLQEFSTRGVNIVRIESRPTGAGLGRYSFSVDCEGHIAERRVGEALMGLKRTCPKVRFLGSYPQHSPDPPDGTDAGSASHRAFAAASAWLGACRAGQP